MPENLIGSYSATLYNAAIPIGTVSPLTTTPIQLPAADSYSFYADLGTMSGTSPLLDIELQISPDNGTSWYAWARFPQMTNTASTVQARMVIQPTQGRGEAASVSLLNTGTTNSAFAANAPICSGSSSFRVRFTISGTSAAFGSVKVWCIAAPRSVTP